MLKQLFSSIFPLPQPLTQIIQAQAFLLLSPNKHPHLHPPKSIFRCLQYPTQQQAHQHQLMYTSLTNAFHLRIINSHVKPIAQNHSWALLIEIESPKSSLKQRLTLNQANFTHFTESQLILILNSLNVLYSRHLAQNHTSLFTFNQLIDNLFVTENQLIKLAVPSLMVPLHTNKNKEVRKINDHKQIMSNMGIFILEIITLQDKKSLLNLKNLIQKLNALEFRTFPMKQLQSYLLSKVSQWVQSNHKTRKLNQTNPRTNLKQYQKNQTLKQSDHNKSNKNQFQSPSNYQSRTKQITGINLSRRLNKKMTTLNEMANDKIVQSFQQDEYSYILQSNNSSPSRISPHKGFPNQNFLNFSQEPNLSGFSPQQPYPQSDEKSRSPNIDTQSQPMRQSLSNSKTSNMQNSNLNSIIFQVEQQSNYDFVEGSSLKSDIIDLSFSQNEDGPQLKQVQDIQNGSKYFGEVSNGKKHGKGKMFYQDGGFYEGEWKENTIFGFGKLFYPSNKLAYAGYWKDGCFHGPGLVLNQEIQAIREFDFTDFTNLGRYWISYRGNFNMDVREGFGIVKLSNGDSIGGTWENNCLNGEAEYRRHDGQVIKGIWKNNRLQKILKQEVDL